MIVIVDSNGANLFSIVSSIERLGKEVIVSANAQEIVKASHVILPGVGSAAKIMARLHDLHLVDCIKSLTQPVLGICVGMQILFESSEEGQTNGLGIMEGHVSALPKIPGLCLPHMGWNSLQAQQHSPLLQGIAKDAFVYFVHGFAASISKNTIAATEYGQAFSAVVVLDNFVGMQFHPERSGAVGQQLLKNFCNYSPDFNQKGNENAGKASGLANVHGEEC